MRPLESINVYCGTNHVRITAVKSSKAYTIWFYTQFSYLTINPLQHFSYDRAVSVEHKPESAISVTFILCQP